MQSLDKCLKRVKSRMVKLFSHQKDDRRRLRLRSDRLSPCVNKYCAIIHLNKASLLLRAKKKHHPGVLLYNMNAVFLLFAP